MLRGGNLHLLLNCRRDRQAFDNSAHHLIAKWFFHQAVKADRASSYDLLLDVGRKPGPIRRFVLGAAAHWRYVSCCEIDGNPHSPRRAEPFHPGEARGTQTKE